MFFSITLLLQEKRAPDSVIILLQESLWAATCSRETHLSVLPNDLSERMPSKEMRCETSGLPNNKRVQQAVLL